MLLDTDRRFVELVPSTAGRDEGRRQCDRNDNDDDVVDDKIHRTLPRLHRILLPFFVRILVNVGMSRAHKESSDIMGVNGGKCERLFSRLNPVGMDVCIYVYVVYILCDRYHIIHTYIPHAL